MASRDPLSLSSLSPVAQCAGPWTSHCPAPDKDARRFPISGTGHAPVPWLSGLVCIIPQHCHVARTISMPSD